MIPTDGVYKPPHPTTLSRKLNDLSANLKQKFIDKLKSGIGDSRPSITFDHWKADNDTNYLVPTVHYISASWKQCYGCYGVTACVVYTADSIRKFDSKIRFEIESDGRFDSRFDSNAKKRFAAP